MSNDLFIGIGMEKLHLIYVLMPFVFGAMLFLLERIFNKNILLLGTSASLSLMTVAGYFFYQFSFADVSTFTMDWEHLHYPGFVLGVKVNSFNLLFSIVNSILLFLTVILFSGKKANHGSSGICMAFIVTGLANCAFMAKSIYTFFILSEMIFFIHYFCCCRIYPREKITSMRILNTFSAIVLFGAILYVGKEGYEFVEFFDTGDTGLSVEKIGVFSSVTFYFIIKLFFFPFVGRNSKDNGPLNVVNNLLLENVVLMLFVYKFKKYIVDVLPRELQGQMSSVMLIFVVMSSVLCAISFISKSFLRKKVLTKHSLICLMLGAFLSLDADVHVGVFTLLICHVYCMVALYVFFDGKYSNSKKFSGKEIFLLAAILCSMMFFPLSGNFVGFFKILLGYKSVQPYFLFFIFSGLMFLFMSWIKEFFLLTEEGGGKKGFLSNGSFMVISICLLIIFWVGLNPMVVELFM